MSKPLPPICDQLAARTAIDRNDRNTFTQVHSGYTAFNGHVFSQSEADAYNNVVREAAQAKANGSPQHQFLLDQSHRLYQSIITHQ